MAAHLLPTTPMVADLGQPFHCLSSQRYVLMDDTLVRGEGFILAKQCNIIHYYAPVSKRVDLTPSHSWTSQGPLFKF